MKILIISSYLPYPLYSGGQVRLYNLIKELSVNHEITLICEKRIHQTQDDIDELRKICSEVKTFDRPKQWSFANVLKAGSSSHSFLLTGHTSLGFSQLILETIEQKNFDVIHVETYYVMQNLLIARRNATHQIKNPLVLVEHNIEYKVYEKFKKRAAALLRPLLQIDIAKIKKEEESFWKISDALVAVSREDQIVMKHAGVMSFLVSNGVNTDLFTFKKFEERFHSQNNTKKILFLGDFKWIQNQDTVKYIIKEIWPLFKELLIKYSELDNIKLWIVGRNIPESIRNLTIDTDVIFDEESSQLSTEKIFHQAALLLAPIRVGGGTSYKILEAMSSGTPVVTMQMSSDALAAKNDQNILIGNNAQELAAKCIQVLMEPILYKRISKNGRELVENKYTWNKIGKNLVDVYKSVL